MQINEDIELKNEQVLNSPNRYKLQNAFLNK